MLNIINFILLGGEFIWILFKKDFCCFVSARQAFITVWSFWGFRIVLETLSRANFTLFCGTIFLESNKILVQVWPRCSGLQACVCTARLSWQISRLFPWIPLYSRAPPSSSCLCLSNSSLPPQHWPLPTPSKCSGLHGNIPLTFPSSQGTRFFLVTPLSPPVLW